MAKAATKIVEVPAPAPKGRGKKDVAPAPTAAPAPKGRGKKDVAPATPTPAPATGTAAGRGKPISFDTTTIAGLARTRIKEGKSDEDVLKDLRAKFGDVPGNAAKHYRADMAKRGLI